MSREYAIAELGNPILRKQAAQIEEIADPQTQALIDDLFKIVAEAGGMGIAAPQIGVSQRLFIMCSQPNSRYPHAPHMEPTAVINPRITGTSTETEKGWEGCLSVPGLRGLVPRHKTIQVTYTTREGETLERQFSDFLAVLFQHELDHLDGLVFLDRVESNRDLVSEKEWQRRMAEAQ